MADLRFHPDLRRRTAPLLVAVATGFAVMTAATPQAAAEDFVYLLNVTVRPYYHFASADAALDYGHGLCAKVAQGTAYPHLVGEVEHDFDTTDEFQASYLITQAVNELCPESIWQLRNSAAGYRVGDVR